MTVKYIAFDGTQFDTEDECYNYERRIKLEDYNNSNDIIMFDNCGQRIFGDFDDTLNNSSCVFLSKQFADEYIQDLLLTFFILNQKGLYYYDYNSDTWKEAKDYIIKLTRKLKKFQNITNYLNKCVE